jgi:hypothetical protein
LTSKHLIIHEGERRTWKASYGERKGSEGYIYIYLCVCVCVQDMCIRAIMFVHDVLENKYMMFWESVSCQRSNKKFSAWLLNFFCCPLKIISLSLSPCVCVCCCVHVYFSCTSLSSFCVCQFCVFVHVFMFCISS